MSVQPPAQEEKFKAEMPQIPGVGSNNARTGGMPAPVIVIGGLVAVVLAVVVIGTMVSRSHRAVAPAADPPAQIEVPAPDLGNPPQKPPVNAGIATIDQMAKPWSATQFDFQDPLSRERIAALLIRLPNGSATQPAGYWAMNLKAPYNNCDLEYVNDLNKLKTEYGYPAKHPMVGNPCSRTVFDPTKLMSLAGNVWVRGAIVQGSDLRPPLGIQLKIEGKDIFAVRME